MRKCAKRSESMIKYAKSSESVPKPVRESVLKVEKI